MEDKAKSQQVLESESDVSLNTSDELILDEISGDLKVTENGNRKRSLVQSLNPESEDDKGKVKEMKISDPVMNEESPDCSRPPPPSYEEAISTLLASNPHYTEAIQEAINNGILVQGQMPVMDSNLQSDDILSQFLCTLEEHNRSPTTIPINQQFQCQQQRQIMGFGNSIQGQKEYELQMGSQIMTDMMQMGLPHGITNQPMQGGIQSQMIAGGISATVNKSGTNSQEIDSTQQRYDRRSNKNQKTMVKNHRRLRARSRLEEQQRQIVKILDTGLYYQNLWKLIQLEVQ